MKHEIIASVLFGAACAFGGDSVWVDRESGIDGEGRGGESTPFASIQAAVEAASDGDTVYVRPGIYDNGFKVDAHGNTNRVMVSDKKLRIVATGTRAETHIVELTKALRRQGHEVVIVSNGGV